MGEHMGMLFNCSILHVYIRGDKMIIPELKDYTIGAHVHAWCDCHIKAENIEAAARVAQKLEMKNFVKFVDGAYNDGRLEIIQIYDTDSGNDL